MTVLHFQKPDGSRVTIEARDGWSVMEEALAHDVEGIVAECGGSMACATCHVMLEPEVYAKLDPPTETENDMLDFTVMERSETSRLACQVKIAPEIDGLIVYLPEAQV